MTVLDWLAILVLVGLMGLTTWAKMLQQQKPAAKDAGPAKDAAPSPDTKRAPVWQIIGVLAVLVLWVVSPTFELLVLVAMLVGIAFVAYLLYAQTHRAHEKQPRDGGSDDAAP